MGQLCICHLTLRDYEEYAWEVCSTGWNHLSYCLYGVIFFDFQFYLHNQTPCTFIVPFNFLCNDYSNIPSWEFSEYSTLKWDVRSTLNLHKCPCIKSCHGVVYNVFNIYYIYLCIGTPLAVTKNVTVNNSTFDTVHKTVQVRCIVVWILWFHRTVTVHSFVYIFMHTVFMSCIYACNLFSY